MASFFEKKNRTASLNHEEKLNKQRKHKLREKSENNAFTNFVFCSIVDGLESTEKGEWKLAMDEEIQSHVSNHMWDLVDLPRAFRAM